MGAVVQMAHVTQLHLYSCTRIQRYRLPALVMRRARYYVRSYIGTDNPEHGLAGVE
jgi:hypothetical protein